MKVLRAATLCALSCLAGCAPALREPAALEDLAGGVVTEPGETPEAMAARAAARFALRDAPAVREAAALWTRAAAGLPEAVAPLLDAARARVWLADHLEDPGDRSREAEAAVQTAQWCRRRAAGEAACTYWLAVALGVQARERRSTALDALPRIERLFREAAESAPSLDDAGPDRALALFYARAPGWPTGPGDPDLALIHARRAVELRPDHPPNVLALGEALEGVGRTSESREAYARAARLAAERRDLGDAGASEWLAEAEQRLASPR